MDCKVITAKDVLVIGMKASVTFQSMSMEMSKLARTFMPRKNEVLNRVGEHTFSIQDYKQQDFKVITPQATFDKWFAVEVANFNSVPNGMETLVLKGGDYLVINYKGTLANFPKVWQFVLNDWFPKHNYELDYRPHFEKLPASYNPMNVENEEEVWIPIRLR